MMRAIPLVLVAGVVVAAAGTGRLTVESVPLGNGVVRFTVVNTYSAALTAYAGTTVALVTQPDGRVLRVTRDWYRDSVRWPNERPILPGQEFSKPFGGRGDSVTVTFRAGVFADGATYGDQEYVRRIVHRRRVALDANAAVMAAVDAGVAARLSVAEMGLRLRQVEDAMLRASESEDWPEVRGIFSGARSRMYAVAEHGAKPEETFRVLAGFATEARKRLMDALTPTVEGER